MSQTETSCPHCGGRITFYVNVVEGPKPDPVKAWQDNQSEETRQMIASAQSNGLLSAFEQAVNATIHPAPKNLPKFFIGFLKVARPMKLHGAQRLVLHNEFKNQSVEVLQHMRIAALILDGALALFFPADYLAANSLVEGKVQVGEICKSQGQLADWRKTRNGLRSSGSFGILRRSPKEKHRGVRESGAVRS